MDSAAGEQDTGGGGARADPGGRDIRQSPALSNTVPVLRERVLAAQSTLLKVLNKLPGKEGKRWIVLPFSMDGGLDVCLRVLLAPPGTTTKMGAYWAEQMTLDISDTERHWTFALRTTARGASLTNGALLANKGSPGGRSSGVNGTLPSFSLDLARYPALAADEREVLARAVADCLGVPVGRVHVRGDEEFPYFAEDSRDWILRSINKEV
jgi:hypothetical protein